MTDSFQIGDWIRPKNLTAYPWFNNDMLGKQVTPGLVDAPKLVVVLIRPPWLICAAGATSGYAPVSLRASECTLLCRPEVKEGDLVYLTKDPVIDEDRGAGWIPYKHFLVQGASAVVAEVDYAGAYLQFHLESYQSGWGPDSTKVFSSEEKRGLFYFMNGSFSKIAPINPDPGAKMPSYRLSFFALKQGMNRPATYLLQQALNALAETHNQSSWKVTADGGFGPKTTASIKAVQEFYKLGADGVVGKDTWRIITPDLGSYVPPLYLRIAECQCSWESGKRGFEYYGMIPQEGWYNFGIYNVNKDSAKALLACFGQQSLGAVLETNPQAVGEACGSKEGREAQVGSYPLKYLLKPSLQNLAKVGWSPSTFGLSSLEDFSSMGQLPARLDPLLERLLLLSFDITVNSGAGGFFPMKTPRAWSGSGDMAWPEDRLPPKESVKKIFSEVFGKPITSDFDYVTSDTRDTYKVALKRSLDELCASDQQRLELIAELQGRCVVDAWRSEVTRRRRTCVRPEGCTFQGTAWNVAEHFGIGL